MTFRLRPVGGMFNRTQAILSYRAAHGPLLVHWTADVPHFLEVFEPLEGVTFHEQYDHTDKFDYGIAEGAPERWRDAYAELRPIASIRERVAAFRATLGTYLAIHVRRTDMTPLAIRIGCPPPSDEEYLAWVYRRREDISVNAPVWVATDNGESQRKFEGWLGTRFRSGCVLDGKEVHAIDEHKVYGRIEDAIVDMWMCRHACEAMTQDFGTFSGTIRILRGLDACAAPVLFATQNTDKHGTRFIVYRGSPSHPEMLAVCPTQEAANAAYRLFSIPTPN